MNSVVFQNICIGLGAASSAVRNHSAQVLAGVILPPVMNQLQEQEIMTQEKEYYYGISAILQASEIFVAARMAFKALNQARIQVPYTTPIALGAAVIPLGMNYLASRECLDEYPLAKRAICLLRDNLGNISLGVAMISSVALIALGQPVFGGVALTMLTMGILGRCEVVPPSIRNVISGTCFVIQNATFLVLGGPILKTCAIMNIACVTFDYFIPQIM